MELRAFIRQVKSFNTLSHPDRIKLFAWWLHTHQRRERFDVAAIRACYSTLDMHPSSNPSRDLARLEERRPRVLLKDARGCRLEGSVRAALDARFGEHETAITVSQLLKDLPRKINGTAEGLFLSEALICYKHQAFRAAIVMTWNLAYDHLLAWVVGDAQRLGQFNTAITKRFPNDKKKAGLIIQKHEDFSDWLKESEVIAIAAKAGLFSDNVKKILEEKLVRRNIAAHPSLVEITRAQADDAITDLVNNVVLKLT